MSKTDGEEYLISTRLRLSRYMVVPAAAGRLYDEFELKKVCSIDVPLIQNSPRCLSPLPHCSRISDAPAAPESLLGILVERGHG